MKLSGGDTCTYAWVNGYRCAPATQSDCLAWFNCMDALHMCLLQCLNLFLEDITAHSTLISLVLVSFPTFFCCFSIPNELLDPVNATLFTKSQLITYQLEARLDLNGSVAFRYENETWTRLQMLSRMLSYAAPEMKTSQTNLSAYCLNDIEFESVRICFCLCAYT